MIFKCRITLAHTEWTNVNILYFLDSIEIISIEELGFRYNKTLVGQQFRPTLELLCNEDFNVGLL